MERQTLVRVWQGILTPKRVLNELERTGLSCLKKRKRILEILSAVKERAITVNEAEQDLREEGVEYEDENSCQI
ncbi:MAG: hypothetical protein ABIK27_08970 [Bacteroidota bacterium]